jgi:hypothetical protein
MGTTRTPPREVEKRIVGRYTQGVTDTARSQRLPDQIQSLIESKTYSVESLRLDHAFVIPIYQRPFEWSKELVRRFATDLIGSSSRIADESHRIDFVGSIITAAVPDDDIPQLGAPPSANVHTLVDGQQRLTVLFMLAIAFSDYLERNVSQHGFDDHPAEKWLEPHIAETLKRLRELVGLTAPGQDRERQPRLIRLVEDSWGLDQDSSAFRSPVATLAAQCLGRSEGARFRYEAPAGPTGDIPSESGDYRHLQLRYEDISQLVGWLTDGSRGPADGLPDPAAFLSESFKEAEWYRALGLTSNADLRPQLISHIRSSGLSSGLAGSFRLFVASRFLLSRTVVSWARAQHEDHALEMFDALNTMGTPLTALACFKPRVVSHFGGTRAFRESDVGKDFTRVESIIGLESSSERRRNMARDLSAAYVLAESGQSPSAKLPDQRAALRKSFEEAETAGSSEEAIRLLRRSAEFLFEQWPHPDRVLAQQPSERLASEAALSLALLKDSGHTVVQPLLARFWHEFKEERLELVDWFRVLRALGAFWVLWRSGNEGRYPDAYYRGLLQGAPATDDPTSWSGFRRLGGTSPTYGALAEQLRSQLREISADDEDRWVAASINAPLYERQRQVARALLLAASHYRVANDTHAGQLDPALQADETAWLRYARWAGSTTLSLEHIAPRKASSAMEDVEDVTAEQAWDSSFYVASRVHQIGNLTLLRLAENSAVSNRSWAQKRVIYRALAQVTREHTVAVLDAEGAQLPDAIRESIVQRGTYAPIPVLASAATFETFGLTEAQSRGETILRCAYNTLTTWLAS